MIATEGGGGGGGGDDNDAQNTTKGGGGKGGGVDVVVLEKDELEIGKEADFSSGERLYEAQGTKSVQHENRDSGLDDEPGDADRAYAGRRRIEQRDGTWRVLRQPKEDFYDLGTTWGENVSGGRRHPRRWRSWSAQKEDYEMSRKNTTLMFFDTRKKTNRDVGEADHLAWIANRRAELKVMSSVKRKWKGISWITRRTN